MMQMHLVHERLLSAICLQVTQLQEMLDERLRHTQPFGWLVKSRSTIMATDKIVDERTSSMLLEAIKPFEEYGDEFAQIDEIVRQFHDTLRRELPTLRDFRKIPQIMINLLHSKAVNLRRHMTLVLESGDGARPASAPTLRERINRISSSIRNDVSSRLNWASVFPRSDSPVLPFTIDHSKLFHDQALVTQKLNVKSPESVPQEDLLPGAAFGFHRSLSDNF
jgi:hypothetical protein